MFSIVFFTFQKMDLCFGNLDVGTKGIRIKGEVSSSTRKSCHIAFIRIYDNMPKYSRLCQLYCVILTWSAMNGM